MAGVVAVSVVGTVWGSRWALAAAALAAAALCGALGALTESKRLALGGAILTGVIAAVAFFATDGVGAADLAGAQLRGAYLANVDLRGASLRGADLREACLAGADLRGADLEGADFAGADVSGVQVEESMLTSVRNWPGPLESSTACDR